MIQLTYDVLPENRCNLWFWSRRYISDPADPNPLTNRLHPTQNDMKLLLALCLVAGAAAQFGLQQGLGLAGAGVQAATGMGAYGGQPYGGGAYGQQGMYGQQGGMYGQQGGYSPYGQQGGMYGQQGMYGRQGGMYGQQGECISFSKHLTTYAVNLSYQKSNFQGMDNKASTDSRTSA